MWKITIIGIFLVATFLSSQSQELPSEFELCQRSNEKFHDCLRNAIKNALIFLRDGYNASNIPSIDPYFIEYEKTVHVPEGSSAANFNLRSEIRNVSLTGLATGLEIRRVATKFSDKTFQMKIEALLPEIKLEGNYKLKGQMLILRMNGQGKMKVVQKNVTGIMSFKGDIIQKDGIDYINMTSMTSKLTPTSTFYFLENVFNGDPILSDTINGFMNENWKEVNEILLPAYFRIINEKFRHITNLIFNNVPMDMIFLK